jgi:tetratricopeptide (TPR) repeat protein
MNAAHKTPRQLHRRPRSPEFVRTAKALLLRRRTNEAINLLRRGLNLDPTCYEAALLLSKCLIAAKRLQEARLTLEKLADRDETLDAFLLLGRVNSALKDHTGVIEVAKRGLARFPDEPQLRGLIAESRLELTELLEDTTDPDAGFVDPEDLPTIPDAHHAQADRLAPFAGLLAEASSPDTVRIAETAVIVPPAPEELATAPAYRQGDDGVFEEALVIEPYDDEERSTPTPLPSDDLGFDREPSVVTPPARRVASPAAGAPDVISAVKRLVEPETPQQEPSPGPLFGRLLDDGPPIRHLKVLPSPQDEEGGGPTLADAPSAKRAPRRKRRLTPAGFASPSPIPVEIPRSPRQTEQLATPPDPPRPGDPASGLEPPEDPTLDLRGKRSKMVRLKDPLGHSHSHTIDDSRVALPLGGEVIVLEPPQPQVTMPSPKAPRVMVAPELEPARQEDEVKIHRLPLRKAASPTEPVEFEEPTTLARWWPLWLTLALLVIAASTVAGLMVRQKSQISRNLTRARALAAKHQAGPLKKALHHIREAANLGGRGPRVVALAAAIHTELVYEFGESDLGGAQSLVEEATRLDAEAHPRARQDLAVARAYLQLSKQPLPEAIGYLFKSSERHRRNRRLKLLYGRALILNGEHELARKVLDELSADDLEVLQARALLFWKAGHRNLAARLLRLAVTFGLDPDIAAVELARYQTIDGAVSLRTHRRLLQVATQPSLPRRQAAWAHLLLAKHHYDRRQHLKTSAALSKALSGRPIADAEFHYQAGRLLLSVHRLDAAAAEAKEACRIAPRDSRYAALQASVELAMDRPEAVTRRLADATDITVEAKIVLAEAHIRRGALSEAKAILDQLPRNPRSPSAPLVLALARLHVAAGRPYRALRELGDLDPAKVTEAQVLRGLIALKLGDLVGTMRWMKNALKKDPLQADALWALGVVARKRADARHALDYLSKAVQANPYHRQARLQLGNLQLLLGHNAAAQRQFDELLLLEPSSLAALIGRARSSVEQGSQEAPLFIRALRVRGHVSVARTLEARLLMVKGKLNEAAHALRSLLRLKQGKPEQLTLWLAETEHRRADLANAADLYRRVISLEKRSPAAKVGLAELSFKRDKLATALRHGLDAADDLHGGIYPTRLRARIGIQLARCYRLGDALGAAIAELQDVLEVDRSNRDAHLELGMIYASLGKRDRAIHHLARVLEIDKKNEVARRELARVCKDLSPAPADCMQ